MPIYAYRCAACGHAQDVLQKMSDPLLSVCPACGAAAFTKQLTAAGFQLKGSGWYVTDFRDGKNAGAKKDDKPGDAAAAPEAADTKAAGAVEAKPGVKADAKADAKPSGDTAPKPADKPAPSPPPAAPPAGAV